MPTLRTPCYRVYPTLYAKAKTGSIRCYEISVRDFGNYAIMTTKKKVTLEGKWTTDEYKFTEGVNIGKANETTYLQQAFLRAESAVNKLKDSGFVEELSSLMLSDFNTDANGNMKPMLAIGFNEKKIKFPCYIQPKYDGVRCTISLDKNGKVLILSRNGKPYDVPHVKQWAEENKSLLPLDGELYCHKELTFQEIISAVKKRSNLTDKIRFVVYDRPVANETNKTRLQFLQKHIPIISDYRPVYLSSGVLCANMEDITTYHLRCVEAGYEGAIIRNLDGLYEFGFRSNNLIKMKKFDDAEFEILSVVEALGRDEGTAVFVCACKGGEFKVKPQGSRELRKEYFDNAEDLIGKMVTVQYQGLTDEGLPRFPSAISIRDYE